MFIISNIIAPKDKYKFFFIINWVVFVLLVMPFALKNVPPTYQWAVSLAFWEYSSMFTNLFVDDFNVFNDWKTHLDKLCLCLDKCWECDISLHPKKCMFIVYLRIILEYIISNKSKLPTPKKLFPIIIMPSPKTPKDIKVYDGMAVLSMFHLGFCLHQGPIYQIIHRRYIFLNASQNVKQLGRPSKSNLHICSHFDCSKMGFGVHVHVDPTNLALRAMLVQNPTENCD
jgi:hypothetical protein